ncbi:MAG: GGDEF domain-containing protein [Myxococcales bacterium]|nr:GGDEF domain-containing protein [Myxococcales bacterium]
MSLLAGLRQRRSLGEVSLELASSRARVQVLEETAVAMLGCVQALVLDIEELGAPELQTRLGTLRIRLQGGGKLEILDEEVGVCRRDALEFAEHERAHLASRDAELRRIIQVLTDGLADVGAGTAAYHRQLLENGARFEAASRLSDLSRMRASITLEVAALRSAVAERQAAESTMTAAMRTEIDQLRAKVERANHAAQIDPLTQAANRASFDEALGRACELAESGGAGFALLLADIDHFKQINDTHGHPVGDRVLQGLVAFLRDRVRRDDLIARWGGEEFAIVLPGATARIAFAKAKKLVSELADADWTIDAARTLRFSASIGVTAWRADDTPATIVERVDHALYAAKRGGRNRAVKA